MMFINTIDVQDHRYDNTLIATGTSYHGIFLIIPGVPIN